MKNVRTAGGVVVNTDGDILVVSGSYASWSLPKGTVELEEDLLTAAKREIHEESGIEELEYIAELGTYQRTGGKNNLKFKTISIFLFHTKEKELQPIDPKNPEARWVKIDDVVDILTRVEDKQFWLSVKDAVKKLCAKK